MPPQSQQLAADPIYIKLCHFIPDALIPNNERYDTLLRMLRDKNDHSILATNFSFLWKVLVILRQYVSEFDERSHNELIQLLSSFDGKAPLPVLQAWCVFLFSLTQVSATWVPTSLQALCRVFNGPYAYQLFQQNMGASMPSDSSSSSSTPALPSSLNTLQSSSQSTEALLSTTGTNQSFQQLSTDSSLVDLENLQVVVQSTIANILIKFPLSASHVQKAFMTNNPHASAPLSKHCLWVHNALRLCENCPNLRESCFSAVIEKTFKLDINCSQKSVQHMMLLQSNYLPSGFSAPSQTFTLAQRLESDDDDTSKSSSSSSSSHNDQESSLALQNGAAKNLTDSSDFKTIEWLLSLLLQYLYFVAQNPDDEENSSSYASNFKSASPSGALASPSPSHSSHRRKINNDQQQQQQQQHDIDPSTDTLEQRQARLKSQLLQPSRSPRHDSQPSQESNDNDDAQPDDLIDPSMSMIPLELRQNENSNEEHHLLNMLSSRHKKHKHRSTAAAGSTSTTASSDAIDDLDDSNMDDGTPFAVEFSGLLQATRAQGVDLLSALKSEDNNTSSSSSSFSESSLTATPSNILKLEPTNSHDVKQQSQHSSLQHARIFPGAGSGTVSTLSDKLCESIIRCFNRTVLRAQHTFFVQWLLFFQCSFRFEYVEVALRLLVETLRAPSSNDSLCTSCILYLGSFVVRARYIRTTSAATVVQLLARFTHGYLERHIGTKQSQKRQSHSNRSSSHANMAASQRLLETFGSHIDVPLSFSANGGSSSLFNPASHPVFYFAVEILMYISVLRPDLIRCVEPLNVAASDGSQAHSTVKAVVHSNAAMKRLSMTASAASDGKSTRFSTAAIRSGPFVAQNGGSLLHVNSSGGSTAVFSPSLQPANPHHIALDLSPNISPMLRPNMTNTHMAPAFSLSGPNSSSHSHNASSQLDSYSIPSTTQQVHHPQPQHFDPLAIRRLLLSPFRPAQYLSPLLLERYLIHYHGCTSILTLQPPNTNPSAFRTHQSSTSNNNTSIAVLYSKLEPSVSLLNLPLVYIPSINQTVSLSSCLLPNNASVQETEFLLRRVSPLQCCVLQIFLKQQQLLCSSYGIPCSTFVQHWDIQQLYQKLILVEQSADSTSSILRFEQLAPSGHHSSANTVFSSMSGLQTASVGSTPSGNIPSTPSLVMYLTLDDLIRVGVFPQLHSQSPLSSYTGKYASPPKFALNSAAIQQKLQQNGNFSTSTGMMSSSGIGHRHDLPQDISKLLTLASDRTSLITTQYREAFFMSAIQLSFIQLPFDPYYPATIRNFIMKSYYLTFDLFSKHFTYSSPKLQSQWVSLTYNPSQQQQIFHSNVPLFINSPYQPQQQQQKPTHGIGLHPFPSMGNVDPMQQPFHPGTIISPQMASTSPVYSSQFGPSGGATAAHFPFPNSMPFSLVSSSHQPGGPSFEQSVSPSFVPISSVSHHQELAALPSLDETTTHDDATESRRRARRRSRSRKPDDAPSYDASDSVEKHAPVIEKSTPVAEKPMPAIEKSVEKAAAEKPTDPVDEKPTLARKASKKLASNVDETSVSPATSLATPSAGPTPRRRRKNKENDDNTPAVPVIDMDKAIAPPPPSRLPIDQAGFIAPTPDKAHLKRQRANDSSVIKSPDEAQTPAVGSSTTLSSTTRLPPSTPITSRNIFAQNKKKNQLKNDQKLVLLSNVDPTQPIDGEQDKKRRRRKSGVE